MMYPLSATMEYSHPLPVRRHLQRFVFLKGFDKIITYSSNLSNNNI